METIDGFINIENNLKRQIEEECQRIGVLCRVFSRSKDIQSLKKKIEKKEKEFREKHPEKTSECYYSPEGKKVQDIIGIRIVTYFYEDVELLWDFFGEKYDVIDTNNPNTKNNEFGVVTKNMVCKLPEEEKNTFNETQNSFYNQQDLFGKLDSTFEIQFRTILSEGWHEIEHDLRYKNKDDWDYLDEDSRTLNGIYATLETSERAMKALFNDVAHKHYKKHNWGAMLRSKFRMHLRKYDLSESLNELIERNATTIGRSLFKFDRNELIDIIAKSGLHISLTIDNIVFIINYIDIQDSDITKQMPENIRLDIENNLKSFIHKDQ